VSPQALGQQSEYIRATSTSATTSNAVGGSGGSGATGSDGQQLQRALDDARAEAAAAAKNLAAVKTQAQVGEGRLGWHCCAAASHRLPPRQHAVPAALVCARMCACWATTQGLEREYDRLLAEHDKLQRQLAVGQQPGGQTASYTSYKKRD
jgi:hypothetical protein